VRGLGHPAHTQGTHRAVGATRLWVGVGGVTCARSDSNASSSAAGRYASAESAFHTVVGVTRASCEPADLDHWLQCQPVATAVVERHAPGFDDILPQREHRASSKPPSGSSSVLKPICRSLCAPLCAKRSDERGEPPGGPGRVDHAQRVVEAQPGVGLEAQQVAQRACGCCLDAHAVLVAAGPQRHLHPWRR
jgi:hypothetical protein